MKKLPIKSTDRNDKVSKSNDINNTSNEEKKLPPVKTKAKTILNVILISLAIIAGTAICTTIIYFGFLCENTEENQIGPNSVLYAEKTKKTSNSKISYKCTDILKNCKECEEVIISNEKGAKNKTEKNSLSSIVCTSCDSGFYPIYNEQKIILFCNKQCETGDLDLCKTCDTENQNQCGECNFGYYLPIDEMIKSKCKYCSDLIENCEDCYGSKNKIECKLCKNNYFLSKEKNICEPKCEIGENNFCKTCNEENNECETCNPGYYLPTDEEDKSKCKKCSDINNKCEECYGTKDNIKCLSCNNNYIPFYNNKNEIIECNPICEIGDYELCKTCDKEKNKCSSCNEGYYLPEDDLYKLKCKKCSDIVKNCNKCHGEIYSVTCDDFNGYNK